MFIDTSVIVALLAREPDADRYALFGEEFGNWLANNHKSFCDAVKAAGP